MAHPRDRHGLTRGRLLKGAAGSAGARRSGVPRGLREHDRRRSAARREARREVRRSEAARARRAAVAAAGQRDHLGDHARQPADPRGPQDGGGPLTVYNYADYLWPGRVKRFEQQFHTKVELATYNTRTRRSRSSPPAPSASTFIGLSGTHIVDLIAQQLLQPLNHSYLPNLRRTSGPSCRTRSTTAAAATRCRTWSGSTGSAGATTRSRRTSPPWTFPGTSSGSPRRTAARSGCSTTSATR